MFIIISIILNEAISTYVCRWKNTLISDVVMIVLKTKNQGSLSDSSLSDSVVVTSFILTICDSAFE